MKAIMISRNSEEIVRILNKEQSILILKTMPKCELPCKVYIYCTKAGNAYFCSKKVREFADKGFCGSVVAEFVLNKITKHEKNYIDIEDKLCYNFSSEDVKKAGFYLDDKNAISTIDTLCEFDLFVERYGRGKPLYAWHIDNLKIYDEPKELCDFLTQGYEKYDDWLLFNNGSQSYSDYLEGWVLRKAPLSWCYVEEY